LAKYCCGGGKRLPQYFFSHTIWYVLLGLSTILELAYVLIKTDQRKLMFGLFLTIAGILFIIEIQVLAVFRAYEYSPMIAAHISDIDDSIIGNVFSQFSIAATALLVSFLNLKKYWYLICALLYGGIEELFLYLGIYHHHWYKTWMTVVGFTVLLWLMNRIYQRAFANPGRCFQYACAFFAVYTLFVHIVSMPIRLFSIPPLKHLLKDDWGSIALNTALSYFPLYGTIMLAHYKRLKWPYPLAVAAVLYALYFAQYAIGYIVYQYIWQVFVLATIHIIGMYLLVHVVDWLYGGLPVYHKKPAQQ